MTESKKRITKLGSFPAQPRLLEPGWLRTLGVYGYDAVEDIILASLVTGDPLLLIGKAGTGKTFLLNSLSEALGLRHRHYNASLIAFDDLVGFPFPAEDGSSIRYIETPATIWQAESVLIDELSRCKPEHQNRLFSLVHERRIQGLDLPSLRYRWAAMNPCTEDESGDDYYDGSVPLDQALADRFAFVIEVPDWNGLDEKDRTLVADARGVDAPSVDQVGLVAAVEEGKRRFAEAGGDLHDAVHSYASTVATALLQPGVRLSPRRVRMLSRNLLALTLVTGGQPESLVFQTGLTASIPQLAWGKKVGDAIVAGAHTEAWQTLTQNEDGRWLSRFLMEPSLARRCRMLFKNAPSRDVLGVAVIQSLQRLPKAKAVAFAVALLPVAMAKVDVVGEEALAALATEAAPALEVEGAAKWRLHFNMKPENNPHPLLSQCAALLQQLPPAREARARQLFFHCISKEIPFDDPRELEAAFDEAICEVQSILNHDVA
ncbi:MAG: AAA family ATPase [Verrucomicrobiales bacterium]